MKVEITQVRVNLGIQKIELSVDEARALRAELNRLFAGEVGQECDLKKRVEELERDRVISPFDLPYRPIWIDPIDKIPFPEHWKVTCATNSAKGVALSVNLQS